MSAVIPFNCSNNHTTDHFGREGAIVRRENLQIQYEIIEELGLPEHRHQDIPVDQKIRFTDVQTQYKYDKPLRHIAVFNQESGVVELLTNINTLSASNIALLYRSGWAY